jgi:hypothetical protein
VGIVVKKLTTTNVVNKSKNQNQNETKSKASANANMNMNMIDDENKVIIMQRTHFLSPSETKMDQIQREARGAEIAVDLAMSHLKSQMQKGATLKLVLDCLPLVRQLVKGGGKGIVSLMVERMLKWWLRSPFHIDVAWVPAKEHLLADQLSRPSNNSDLHHHRHQNRNNGQRYKLNRRFFQRTNRLRNGHPWIDLFNIGPERSDAFLLDWTNRQHLLLYPSFHDYPRVVEKLESQPPRSALLVVPRWTQGPHSNWHRRLSQMCKWQMTFGPNDSPFDKVVTTADSSITERISATTKWPTDIFSFAST